MKAAPLLIPLLPPFYFALTGERVGGLPAARRGRHDAEHLAEGFEVVLSQLNARPADLRLDPARVRERGDLGV